jgi:thiol:disulfide interchange protein
MFRPSVFLSALILALPAARAQFELPSAAPTTSAVMVAEVKTLAPGATFSVALHIRQPSDWHSYYQNSGGVEQPPAIKWTLPAGFAAGPIQWPTPEVKDGFFGKSFVYPRDPVLLIDITAPATLETGKAVTLSAAATWQICADMCLNGQQALTLNLPVASAIEMDPAAVELFAKARASQPAKPGNRKITAQAAGDTIVLSVEPGATPDQVPTDFVPNQPFVKAASDGGSITRDGNAWLIRLQRATKDALDQPIPQGKTISGILLGPAAVAIPETAIAGSAAPAAPASPPTQALPFAGFLNILGLMLLGGLILNLMPCVFPVIGLKIMGFVQQAGAERKKIALHGLIFSLGVLVSFGVVSGILFVVRAASGAGAIGWGYQLQNPWVVLCLMVLMFVLALNMYGVFEMGSSATSLGGSLQTKHGFAGSFFSGVLATVVATPCSGPFLGYALAVAIALPALQFFLAFAAMAVGLALPYLVLSVFPRLLEYLPRPGAWMESFKQAMSFLLFATTGYLLWVYAGLIDLEHLAGPIFGLSAIAVAAWIHGRWNLPHRTRRTRLTAWLLAILFAAAGVFLALPPQPSALKWEPWSEARVTSLLDKQTPVYIDFTAQWCATCQFNKARAYTPEVIALMHAKGVVAFKADKTKPDPQIEEALEKLGRTAIPVNVLLAPGKDPVILPSVLSPQDMLEALRKL